MRDLKDQLEALSEAGTARGAASVMEASRHSLDDTAPLSAPLLPQKAAQRPVVIAVAVVVVLALVVSAALMLRGGDQRSTNLVPVVPTPNDLRDLFVTSAATPSPAERLFLVPTVVPEGMRPLRISGGTAPTGSTGGSGSAGIDRSQLWVKLDPTGTRPIDRFFVQWGPGEIGIDGETHESPQASNGDPLAGYRQGSSPVSVRGHDGVFSNREHTLIWEEPAGKTVSISGDSLPIGDLVDMAEALEPRAGGGFTLTQAPPGFVQASETKGFASSGRNERTLIYQDAAGHGFGVRIVDNSETPPGGNLSDIPPGVGSDPHIVEVRDRHAVVTHTLLAGGGTFDSQTQFLMGAGQHVQWLERPNVMVTVSGVGLTEAEVLAIARGLQVVDTSRWEELLVQAPGRSGAIVPKQTSSPPTFTGAQAEVADAYLGWLNSSSDADATAARVEDGEQLRETIAALGSNAALPAALSGRVDAVRMVGADHALVTFSILSGGKPTLDDQQGGAIRVSGRWLVSRATFCGVISIIGTQCPAR